MEVILTTIKFMSILVGSLSFIALATLIVIRTRNNKSRKTRKPIKQPAMPAQPIPQSVSEPPPLPILKPTPRYVSTTRVAPTITNHDDKPDIRSFPTTMAIHKSGQFSASERKAEYRRRGKSPSGVIDGVYNDAYRENGRSYNDFNRDWDADA